MPTPALSDILDAFDALDEWMDRYQYLIDLGRQLDGLPEDERTEERRVLGCTSQVWLKTSFTGGPTGPVRLQADSDAAIVKGLVQVVLALFDGRTGAEIAAVDWRGTFKTLGLEAHLSPSRANGLRSMVERVLAETRPS